MTILVKIFGELREKIKDQTIKDNSPLNIQLEPEKVNTISDILKFFSIERDETSHIFVNGVYSGFDKGVKDGDRVGLFPRKMCLLYKWYFTRAND
ncbi:MAG: MoaD/ThiS family protein [Candidatus Thorarchaeota archaeon]